MSRDRCDRLKDGVCHPPSFPLISIGHSATLPSWLSHSLQLSFNHISSAEKKRKYFLYLLQIIMNISEMFSIG